jgi:hypothetical protein
MKMLLADEHLPFREESRDKKIADALFGARQPGLNGASHG